MAVALETLGDSSGSNWKYVHDKERFKIPYREHVLPIPRQPYVESLSPNAPMPSEIYLPNTLKHGIFKPYLADIYTRSDLQVEQSVSEQDLNNVHRSEVGRNFFFSQLDGRMYPSRLIWGSPDEIPELAQDFYALLRTGYYPVISNHLHDSNLYLPLPSASDWGLFRQNVYSDGTPAIREMSILGKRIQIKALATEESYPLMEEPEMFDFINYWDSKFNGLIEDEYDEVVIRLAESMRVPLFVSTDMTHYTRTTPREIVKIVHERQIYPKSSAA